jgi:UDP-N-acetyl-2-amino-2-deoxyglucuronate dehydrogenase
MLSRSVGFGIVGCGVIAPTHCDAIKDVPGAELVAVLDIDPERARSIGERYGVPYFTNQAEFLAQPGLDVVNILLPSGFHATVGSAAAQAGKHVLVEKPIDVTVESALKLIEACEAAGVKLGVISQHRFAPEVIKVKKAVEAGEFGPLVLGEASIKWYRTQKYYESGNWRGTKALDGGGALMNQGVHYIDLLQWIMGPVESIKAEVQTRTHQIEVEDLAVAVLRFANGALGSITGSTSIFPGLPEKLEIHGQDATALIEADVLKGFYNRANLGEVGNYGTKQTISDKNDGKGPGGAASPTSIGHSLHTAQVADFLAAIQENRDPAITGRDALRPLEIILAIYRSAAENREVKLSEEFSNSR